MIIHSWNVNGIRACQQKGFLKWLAGNGGDVVFVQETKADPDQLDMELLRPPNWTSEWFPAERKGYSGTSVFFKRKPDEIQKGMGVRKFDVEGRSITLFYGKLALVGAYFPNSQDFAARLPYKLEFCEAMLTYCQALRKKGYGVMLCGDYNIAHRPIDLARPKENEGHAGYLPEEREWMTQFLSYGYHDIFRERTGEQPSHYTWWSYRGGARSRNVGWRIDYTNVSDNLLDRVATARHHPEVTGSDHCPVSIELKTS